MASQELEKATLFIINKCREENIIVHRYDAITSDSIYLKFDWGVAHSLRISDHKGIEKYHYRFNLVKGVPKIISVSHKNKSYSKTYPFREIFKCLEDILNNRKEVIEKYDGMEGYMAEVEKTQRKIEKLPKEKLYPFWRYGKRMD